MYPNCSYYPWQEKQWQLLLSQYRQQRLPQALLFQGIQGLGKADFAKAFSAYILCDNTPNYSEACGQCRSCELLRAGNHPDFYWLEPEEKSKSIKVEQLRDLIYRLGQTSQRTAYQVTVIHPAETMNRAAANALLKTLEEPFGDVLIILVCNRVNTLPATILSRCQRIAFFPSADDKTLEWLQQQLKTEVNPALLLKMAEYAPLQALALMDANYFELRDQVLRHLLRIQRKEIDPIAPVVDFLKKDLNLLLHAMMTIVMDMARLRHEVMTDRLVHTDRLAQLQSLSQQADVTELQNYFLACLRAQAALQSPIHINPQLLLENLFIEYSHVIVSPLPSG